MRFSSVAATVLVLALLAAVSVSSVEAAASAPLRRVATRQVVHSKLQSVSGDVTCPLPSLCPQNTPLCELVIAMCSSAANMAAKYISLENFQVNGGQVSGTMTLTGLITGGAPVTFTFAFSGQDKDFTLTSPGGITIPLSSIFDKTGTDFGHMVGSSVSLTINAIGIQMNPLGFHLAGDLVWNSHNTKFEVVLLRDSTVAFGIYIDGTNSVQTSTFADSLAVINSHQDTNPDWLNIQSLNLQLATSGLNPIPAPLAPTFLPSFQQGLKLTVTAQFSSTARSRVMRTLAKILPGAFTFDLVIPPAPQQASLDLLLTDIRINDKLKLANNKLSILFPRGAEPAKIEFSNELDGVTIDGKPLLFKGLAELDLSPTLAITLQMHMDGTIPKLFGIDRLSISDVAGSVNLGDVAPFVDGVSFGATVVLGPLSFEGRFGINWAEPTQNFVYVKLANGLTLGEFLSAFFGRDFAIAKTVLDTGFTPGTMFSVAAASIDDNFFSPPVVISEGIHFNGGVNLFGVGPFLMKVDISMQPPSFAIDATLPVFHIGSCEIRESRGATVGPHLAINSQELKIQMGAFVGCPEFSVDAQLMLAANPEQFSFALHGELAHALQVSLSASAGMGQPFTFDADVDLNLDFWSKVKVFVELRKIFDKLPMISKCPHGWLARKLGITRLCEDLLGPVQALKRWLDNPTIDVNIGVGGKLGAGQILFDVHWDIDIVGVNKHIKGQANICITGTCVHDRISDEMNVLHDIHRAWLAAWDRIKKHL